MGASGIAILIHAALLRAYLSRASTSGRRNWKAIASVTIATKLG
jgi:hypothetical protein